MKQTLTLLTALLLMPLATSVHAAEAQHPTDWLKDAQLFVTSGEAQTSANTGLCGNLNTLSPLKPSEVTVGGEKGKIDALALTIFFLSPQGNDQWSGRLAEPNADKSDGPLATLSGAQVAIRALKSKCALPGPVTVALRGGIYPVQTTLQFTAADSGTKAAPVTYQALKGEEVVISGGKKVFGWKEAAGGLLETEIPGVKEGQLYFNELYIGGSRAKRTRLPKKGFYRINQLVKDSKTEFYFNPGEIQNWTNLRDVNVTCYHTWTASLQWIDSVDVNENKVTFQNPAQYIYKIEQYGGKPPRFYVENVREALTEPGEWYLDRKTGILTYFPKSGETPDNLEAWYPVVDRILNFAGEPQSGSFVEWLSFKDLSFRHSDWGIVPGPTAVVDGQAHVRTRNAMVFAKGLRNSRFENCEFSEGGVHAIWLEQGSSDNTVKRCHIRNFGGGGVYLGDTSYSNDEKLRFDRNTVDNCFIHNLNHRLHGAHGIWIGRSSFNRITHNEISDLDYSPISAGWVWGYKTPSGVEGNLFEYNHLHHYGLGELSDMGGIYTLGISPGTVVRYNIIHDGYAYSHAGYGLYADEGSSDMLLEKNVVYNTRSGGFNQNYGSNNLIRNNIFAFAAEQNIVNNRASSENKSFRFEKNIVMTANGFPVNGAFMSNAFKFEENLYWDLNDNSLTNMSFSGWTWDEWRGKGYDQTSFILDPGFVDPLRADFRLKSETAVQKIGFVPFDDELAKTGLYGDSAWVDLPKKYTPRPVNADILSPATKRIAGSRKLFSEDFEALAPGAPSPFGQSDPAILISTEQAFNGKQSLKFQDDPSNAGDISPYLMFKYDLDPGTIHASMDVFLEEGAIFRHDWRGPGNKDYKIGPSFRFEANGDVTVLGKIISSVPRRKWIHVEMLFENGLKSGIWDLALTVDGEARKTFEGLRCGSSDLESVEKLLFSSMARIKTAFYLDNVRLEVLPAERAE